MSTFITGSTGYLGSYVVSALLRETQESLGLLVRAASTDEALERLWRSLQLHMNFEEFREYMASRVRIYRGDITSPQLGLDNATYRAAYRDTDSIIHIAASLNRKSERVCLNVNMRGTLAMIKFAQAANADHGLRRFSEVSTTAVAGQRQSEVVYEDDAIDWARNDYDPYARSKKFCEHMLDQLLSDVPHTVFRPSIVMGDSTRPVTSQFDMLRAFVFLARLPIIPVPKQARLDIVSADYVSRGIVKVHTDASPKYGIYHLSAGQGSQTAQEIVSKLRLFGKPVRGRLVDRLASPTGTLSNLAAEAPRSWAISRPAALLKVFWPYITFDTIFDNQRVVDALGQAPARCTDYMSELMDFGVSNGFRYPHKPWPDGARVELSL